MNKENYRPVRPKKVVLFPEIGRAKIFLSPTRPHKSNVYENIYIYFFISKKHKQKKFTSKFVLTNVRFFPPNKRKGSLFFNKEKCC